jgi:DnaJ-class molecular chaperone
MAVKFHDYYETLGVARDASEDAIKKAYRKAARKHHPDLNPGNKAAEERFKEVGEAYEVLSDKEKRKRYDALGRNWKAGMDFTPPPGAGSASGGFRGAPGDFGDVFSGGGGFGGFRGGAGGFSDFFESLFGGTGGRRGARGFSWSTGGGQASPGGFEAGERGSDVESEVALSLEEAHRGTRRQVRIPLEERCPECGGSGVKDKKPCPRCHGSGVVSRLEEFTVNIPKGAQDGAVIRVAGKGGAGFGAGGRGDLYLRVHIAPHERFRLRGQGDIEMDLPVAPWEAVLGSQVQVPTLDGPVELRVPPNTQGGRTLRLKGKGAARTDGGRGDQYVRLRIVVPPEPTPRELELMKQLAAESPFDARRQAGGGG